MPFIGYTIMNIGITSTLQNVVYTMKKLSIELTKQKVLCFIRKFLPINKSVKNYSRTERLFQWLPPDGRHGRAAGCRYGGSRGARYR